MRNFLIKRFVWSLFALFGATAIVFGLSRLQGDPRLLYAQEGYGMTPEMYEQLGEELGLNKPLVVQYFAWIGGALKGDLGDSLIARTPVNKLIRDKVANSFQLGFAAWLLATAIGIPLGVISAVKRASFIDYVARGFSALGQAAPPFWVGIMGILFFSVQLDWLPAGTTGDGPSISNIDHFIMPTLTLGWLASAGYLRLTRSAMLEVLDSEFIKFARSKGVNSRRVVWKHAFKNALIPPLTLSALIFAGFINGTVVVETVFTWPGLGKLSVDSVNQGDFPTMTGIVLVIAVIYVVMNFLTDMTYALIDPRIRFS